MKWIVLYSRTGSVMRDVIETSGVQPDLIMTTHTQKHADIMDCLREITDEAVVTLMGYMRIIPPDVCENRNLTVYNIHPAPLILYPDYVGKDQMERAYEEIPDLGLWGNTLHRVIGEVDRGPIINEVMFGADNIDTAYVRSHEAAVKQWLDLLREWSII